MAEPLVRRSHRANGRRRPRWRETSTGVPCERNPAVPGRRPERRVWLPEGSVRCPDLLDPPDEPLVLLGCRAGVVVFGSGDRRERVDQYQGAGPFGMGRCIQRRHRPSHAVCKQHDTFESRSRHHRVQIVGPTLQRRQISQRHWIRKPVPRWSYVTTVANDDSRSKNWRCRRWVSRSRNPGSTPKPGQPPSRAARPREL